MSQPWLSGRSQRGGSFAAGPAAPAGSSGVTRQDDLMHWWKCDETSGTEAADSGPSASGNGLTERPITLLNGASFASGGKNGYAISFDGTNDAASTAENVIAAPSAYTISCWFKGDAFDGSWQQPMGLMQTSIGHLLIVKTGTYIAYHIPSGGGWGVNVTVSETLSDDTWYLYTQTWDGSTMTLYINADSKGTASSASILAGDYEMDVGLFSYTYFFDGLVDDVRLYNVSLSGSEVGKLYNSGGGDW